MDDLDELRAKLAKSDKVITIAELARYPSCRDFHHGKKDQHEGSVCPIQTRYEEALKEYRGEETK